MSVRPSTIAAIRFGYGLSPVEAPPEDAGALMTGVGAGAAELFPSDPLADRAGKIRAMNQARKQGRAEAEIKAIRRSLRRYAMGDLAARIYQRALSPHGFFERLTAFWSDHFTVSARNLADRVIFPRFEPDAIRPHVAGTFGDMLVSAVRHPAMLSYLDQIQSFGPNSRAGKRTARGLNENLAREVLELHTLGVGGAYSQDDVRQFAELLTGYSVDANLGDFRFRPALAEPGAETVLGQSYGGGRPSADHAEAFLRDLAVHPATARHLARKLAVHFVADAPDPGLVGHIEAAWTRAGGALVPVYEALLEHPAAWEAPGAKVRQPLDLVVATIRATGIDIAEVRKMGEKAGIGSLKALEQMNQPMLRPPGPDGWPEEAEAWITPQGLAARLTYAGNAGQVLARRTALDPRTFAEAALGELLRPETAFVVGGAPDRWEGFALTIASPEFNRR